MPRSHFGTSMARNPSPSWEPLTRWSTSGQSEVGARGVFHGLVSATYGEPEAGAMLIHIRCPDSYSIIDTQQMLLRC